MSVEFSGNWLGGVDGNEQMYLGQYSLYCTIINGEAPNDGDYTGPGIYTISFQPRNDSIVAYVDGVEYPAVLIQDRYIRIDGPTGTGVLSVKYHPSSSLLYFGDNASKVAFGYTMTSKLRNTHITNIMYKIAQIEYVLELPITLWNNVEVTVPNYNSYNFLKDPIITYQLQSKINEIIEIVNNLYGLELDSLTTDPDSGSRKITASEIMEIRLAIQNIQHEVSTRA